MDLIFKPIQSQHLPLGYSFLKEALKISFGEDSQRWPNKLGSLLEKNYREVIEKKLLIDSSAVIHVWLDHEIIGQIESSIKKDDPTCGYVSLYYLVPDKRGLGFGSQMDNFVTERLTRLGCERIELTVEPRNTSAIKFYQKCGWKTKGQHPLYEHGILMEKFLSTSHSIFE